MTTRSDLSREAIRLREKGLLFREIAAELGISYSYAFDLVNDPDGSKLKARKDSYRRPCPNCGKLMDGSNGRGPNASRYCKDCAGPLTRKHTRERIISEIQRFAAERGRPPHATDWKAGRGDYPPTSAVYCHGRMQTAPFRSWADAIEAAGFPRPYRGGYRRTEAMRKALSERMTRWSPELIVERIRAWAELYGQPPKHDEWLLRGRGPQWPSTMTVKKHFGRWNKAIEAAGFTPRRGRPPKEGR